MQKCIFFICLVFCTSLSFSQNSREKNKEAILRAMQFQQKTWNEGNIDEFMQSYYHSDSLEFVGKEKIIYGFQNTLERYKKTYPTKASMGELQFSDIKIDVLSETAAFVVGAWKITRADKSTIGGHYTLLFKKINGSWLIVTDHTS